MRCKMSLEFLRFPLKLAIASPIFIILAIVVFRKLKKAGKNPYILTLIVLLPAIIGIGITGYAESRSYIWRMYAPAKIEEITDLFYTHQEEFTQFAEDVRRMNTESDPPHTWYTSLSDLQALIYPAPSEDIWEKLGIPEDTTIAVDGEKFSICIFSENAVDGEIYLGGKQVDFFLNYDRNWSNTPHAASVWEKAIELEDSWYIEIWQTPLA